MATFDSSELSRKYYIPDGMPNVIKIGTVFDGNNCICTLATITKS